MDKHVLSHSILFQHIIVNVLILGWQKGKRHVQCAKEKWSLDLIRTPIQNRQMKKGPPLVNVHHCWQEITILQDDQLSTILVKKKNLLLSWFYMLWRGREKNMDNNLTYEAKLCCIIQDCPRLSDPRSRGCRSWAIHTPVIPTHPRTK